MTLPHLPVFMMTSAVALCSWRTLAMVYQCKVHVSIIWKTLQAPSTIWNQHLKQQQCHQAHPWHHHSHSTLDQSTTSATSSTEAGMLKPPVLPLLNGYHSPAYMKAETTATTPKPSVPPQPDRGHYPSISKSSKRRVDA